MKKLLLALAFVSTTALASPGNDGCVGNCDGGNNGGGTTSVSVGDTNNTNLNRNNNLNLNRNFNANSNQNLSTSHGGTGIGLGGSGTGYGGSAVATGGAQDQSQGQSQGQSQQSSSAAGATAVNSGVQQSVTFQQAAQPTDIRVRTVGEAPSLLTNTTSNCRIAISASAGWLGGAFGFGTSVVDDNCEIITMSQHMHNLGLQVESIEMLCESPRARKVMKSRCPAEDPTPAERVTP